MRLSFIIKGFTLAFVLAFCIFINASYSSSFIYDNNIKQNVPGFIDPDVENEPRINKFVKRKNLNVIAQSDFSDELKEKNLDLEMLFSEIVESSQSLSQELSEEKNRKNDTWDVPNINDLSDVKSLLDIDFDLNKKLSKQSNAASTSVDDLMFDFNSKNEAESNRNIDVSTLDLGRGNSFVGEKKIDVSEFNLKDENAEVEKQPILEEKESIKADLNDENAEVEKQPILEVEEPIKADLNDQNAEVEKQPILEVEEPSKFELKDDNIETEKQQAFQMESEPLVGKVRKRDKPVNEVATNVPEESKVVLPAPTDQSSAESTESKLPSSEENAPQENEDSDIDDSLPAGSSGPPTVILDDQIIIFQRNPVEVEDGLWLFPLSEIAQRLGDQVFVNVTLRTITVKRIKDNVTTSLNLNNGTVSINNKPFRTLFGYEKIIISGDKELVPLSAIVLLLGLTSRLEPGKVILKSAPFPNQQVISTITPEVRKGFSKLLVDYLTSTATYHSYPNNDLSSRLLQFEGGAHNDDYSINSNIYLRSGTDGPPFVYDKGTISLFKRDSIFESHLGDIALSLLRSQYLSGVNFRGLVVQPPQKIGGGKVVFGAGAIPSGQKVIGQIESFLEYKRLTEFAEWSKITKNNWQVALGETIFHDLQDNIFIGGKQTGLALTASAVKSGKYFDIEANSSLSSTKSNLEVVKDTKDKTVLVNESSNDIAPGGDILIRWKPKNWLNFFGQADYYSPNFYTLSGNPFYNSRKQLTGGFNIAYKRFNLNASKSNGSRGLDEKNPSKYTISNLSSTFTPFKSGPTFSVSYNQNENQIDQTRAFRNIIPLIMGVSSVDSILERSTTSAFRASIFQSFNKFNYLINFNKMNLNSDRSITDPLLGPTSSSSFQSLDVNLNKEINNKFGLQTLTQFSNRYNRYNLGCRLGPVFNKRLSLQANAGYVSTKTSNTFYTYNLNLNLKITNKINLNLNYLSADLRKELLAILQYNFIGKNALGAIKDPKAFLTTGKIKGRVFIREIPPPKEPEGDTVTLPVQPVEQPVSGVKVKFANHIYTTDSNGAFVIESASQGIQRVSLDITGIPAYLTAITSEDADVIVEPGRESVVNFILSRYGSLKGKLVIVGEPPIGVKKPKDLLDIRIYLENSDFENLTNIDGSFSLGDIKPGKYAIKVDPDYLPEDLEPVLEEMNQVEIYPNVETQNIEIKVKYKERKEIIKDLDKDVNSDSKEVP